LARNFLGAALALAACGDDAGLPADTLADGVETAADTRADTTATEVAPDVAETTDPDTVPTVDPATGPTVETDTSIGPDAEPSETEVAEDVAPDTLEDTPDTLVDDTLVDDTLAPETVTPDTVIADTVPADVGPIDPCSVEPALPLAYVTLTGFTGSEDFAFREQWAYSVDMNGNLVRDTASGAGQMVLPNLSTFAAGMALLPDGRLAVNDAEQGALVLVSVNSTPVTKVTLLGGLSYPNGIDVDDDGFLYVAEQDAGRVRRVDPTDGTFQIIATDLFNPNGVSFAPGYRRLYVGSFGGGVVYALDRREDGTWTTPVVALALPGFGATGPAIDSCKSAQPGDLCYTPAVEGGRCVGPEGSLTCQAEPGLDPLAEICFRREVGDSCSLKIAGVRYSGTCVDDPFSIEPICDIDQGLAQPCFHGYPGKACVSFQNGPPFFGVCTDAQDIPSGWGYPPQGLFCLPPGTSEGGGLDGLNVDACGTVYVTEYILGRIWRKRPGGAVEIAATLPSQWIPNMHWGNGTGGWDPTILYVADRDQGRMFGLVIGRAGKHTVPSP